MLCASFLIDLIYMLEILISKLAVLNSAKTKTLTTSPSEKFEFVVVCGDMVRVNPAETVHKYLGRNLSGNFLARRSSEFAHCLQVAWKKICKYKHILLNEHVSLVLWLKVFDAVVSNNLTFHFRMASSNPALKSIGLMTSPCFTLRSMMNFSLPWIEPVCPLWSYHNKVQ